MIDFDTCLLFMKSTLFWDFNELNCNKKRCIYWVMIDLKVRGQAPRCHTLTANFHTDFVMGKHDCQHTLAIEKSLSHVPTYKHEDRLDWQLQHRSTNCIHFDPSFIWNSILNCNSTFARYEAPAIKSPLNVVVAIALGHSLLRHGQS